MSTKTASSVFGRDAFRTATGVHAAAVVKAFHKIDADLADTVYSGVPARLVGRAQQIEIGPMSGRSNVVFWLERHGVPADDELVEGAKVRHRVFGAGEIIERDHERIVIQFAKERKELMIDICLSYKLLEVIG